MKKNMGALAKNIYLKLAPNGIGLCVRCLCALACVSESNDAKPMLCCRFFLYFLCGGCIFLD